MKREKTEAWSMVQLNFETFREACRFSGCAYDEDKNKNVVDVCRAPRRQQPEGWAECEEKSCPFCGCETPLEIGKRYAEGLLEALSRGRR